MTFTFGPHVIKKSCVFWQSGLSYAFINIKPVVGGHVLVAPVRLEPSLTKLRSDEVADLFQGAQTIASMLKTLHNTEDLTLAVQDGVLAGQTVPHVHIHLLPRREGDFKRKDDVYYELENMKERIDKKGGEVRSEEDMAREARVYLDYLNKIAELEMT